MPLSRSLVPLFRFVLRTAVELLATALAAASVAFVLLTQAAGEPQALVQAVAAGGIQLDAAARSAWVGGFDAQAAPMDRWWHFVRGMLRGDFGWSWSQQRPVMDVLAETAPYTIALALPALSLALLAALWLGGRHALRPNANAMQQRVSRIMRVLGAVPPAWLALFIALLFAGTLGLLPLQGACNPRLCTPLSLASPLTWLARVPYVVLPVCTLTLVLLPTLTRLQLQATQQVVHRPHVLAAAARGVPPARARARHVARLTRLPLASAAALMVPVVLSGAVFIERVYAWPGLGSTLLQAVALRDYPLVSAIAGMVAIAGVVATRALEAVTPLLDPRRQGAPS